MAANTPLHPRPTGPARSGLQLLRRGAAAALAAVSTAAGAQEAAWTELGRQGLVRVVIVPTAQAADRAAYDRQIALLCAGTETCFVNFYANASGAPVSLPLPEEVAAQATAVYRRSAKQQGQFLRFSCKLVNEPPNCF